MNVIDCVSARRVVLERQSVSYSNKGIIMSVHYYMLL
jgi:hypothetical protein